MLLGLLLMLASGPPPGGDAGDLPANMVRAWAQYIALTESRIERELRDPERFLALDFTTDAAGAAVLRRRLASGEILVHEVVTRDERGEERTVPGGLVHHWRGAVFLPGTDLQALITRLENPSETPTQEDVLALRVLERAPDRLKVYIRMTRTKIVTVTFDTEHDVQYRRHGAGRVSSRSAATRIRELENAGMPDQREKPLTDDHGFLWRLNSYWRYQEVPGGVNVECESVSLSRELPWGVGPFLHPVIARVARESMTRTLGDLRRQHAGR